MMDATPEERISAPQCDVAEALFDALTGVVDGRHISFGGGTVLASRWGHRNSFDVDLFCEPTVYGGLSPRERSGIEDRISKIAGCSRERTWCEDVATYTEIAGIEATVLPGSVVLEPSVPTRLAGTSLRLQGSAQILYAKVVWRMYRSGEIAVRDAYDLAAASIHDPAALARARAHASPRVLATVSAVIDALPKGWTGDDTKALIEPRRRWSEDELRKRVLAALRPDPASLGGGTGQRR